MPRGKQVRTEGISSRIGPALLALAAGASIFYAACAPAGESTLHFPNVAAGHTQSGEELLPVPPPPFTEGIFPCSTCHTPDLPVDRNPHEVEFHSDVVLRHDEKNRWCLDCHDATNRDKLHLADGRLIDFTESYRLCGQCHGPTLRAWKAGEHGKRTGSWSGKKLYRLCVNCHNPHSPRFKPLEPEPPPLRQEQIR